MSAREFRIAAPEAAFGGDSRDRGELASLGELAGVAVGIALVHQSEIERRSLPQSEVGERREIGGIAPVLRHRHVDILHGPADRARNSVGDFDADPQILRLNEVLVLRAAVAEVVAEVDVGRHHVADVAQRIEDALPMVFLDAVIALPHQHLDADIPLVSDLVVRQGLGDSPELVAQMRRVGRHEVVHRRWAT